VGVGVGVGKATEPGLLVEWREAVTRGGSVRALQVLHTKPTAGFQGGRAVNTHGAVEVGRAAAAAAASLPPWLLSLA
jgi:hypothetical protein